MPNNASGKRVATPNYALDMRTVGVSKIIAKRPQNECSKPQYTPKSKNLAIWRGPCCNGYHYWGHGEGHGPKGAKYWKCGDSKCRRTLPVLTTAQQTAAKKRMDEYLKQQQVEEAMSWAEDLVAGKLTEEDA